MNKFSLFSKPIKFNKYPSRDIIITEFIELLKSEQYKTATDKCKQLKKIGDDKELRKHKAEALDYVTFAGTFSERKNDALIKQSGLFAADVDDIENYSEIRESLKKDPYTLLLFESPSGGLKVVIKIPLGVNDFDKSVEAYYDYLNNEFNVKGKVDSKCKDISRACFCSYDPDYYYNENAEIWKEKTEIEEQDKNVFFKKYTESQLRAMLKYIPLRNEGKGLGNHTFTVMMGLIHYSKYRKKDYFPVFRWWCEQFNSGSTVEQMRSKWNEWFDKPQTDKPVTIKSVVYEAFEHGYKEVEKKLYTKDEEEFNENKKLIKAKIKLKEEEIKLRELKNLDDDLLLEDIKLQYQMNNIKLARYMSVEYILRKYHVFTEVMTDKIKSYGENQYYEEIGQEIIAKFLTEEIGLRNTKHTTAEILHLLRTKTYLHDDEIKKTQPMNLLPFRNGVLDINTLKLLPHSPKYYFTYQVPVNYNPKAKCPKIKEFFKQIVNESDLPILYDIFGLALYRINILEKFFILIGRGSNGKSKYLSLVERFIGPNNFSAITLKQLTEDKFSVAKTYKKLVNIGADISGNVIRDSANLKSAAASDSISGQFKFGQIFDFVPSATLIFSANDPPIFADQSDGMYRRPETVRFPNQFGNEKDMAENPNCKRADPNILNKITDEEELSGLLNIALEHLKYILENGQLSIVKSTNELKRAYIMASNPVQVFLEEYCEEMMYEPADYAKGEGGIPAQGFLLISDLYQKYRDFCTEHKLITKSIEGFAKSIKKIGNWVLEFGQKDSPDGEAHNKQRSVRGITWK